MVETNGNYGIVHLAGRVAFPGRKIPDSEWYETELALPAPTQFDLPGCVAVRSLKPIGKKGDEIDVHCRVSGFPRKFFATDKDTGVREQVRQATITLTVVE